MWTGRNGFRHNTHVLVAQYNSIENHMCKAVTSMNDILKESLAIAKSKNRCPFELNQKEKKKGKPETKQIKKKSSCWFSKSASLVLKKRLAPVQVFRLAPALDATNACMYNTWHHEQLANTQCCQPGSVWEPIKMVQIKLLHVNQF